VKLFADGADLASMVKRLRKSADQGLHQQPDSDAEGQDPSCEQFAHEVLRAVPDRAIFLDVFSDDSDEIARQPTTSASRSQSRNSADQLRCSSGRSRRMHQGRSSAGAHPSVEPI
jgi:hypothetical protein